MNSRPYIAESAIASGSGVVQGTTDNKVMVSPDGQGDFLGVFPFEANEPVQPGDPVAITLSGVAKVLAGETVNAGKMAVLAADGAFAELPAADGTYVTCGTFLESGSVGEYVDMIVERGSATV